MKILLKIFFVFLLLFESSSAQPLYWQRIYGLNSHKFSKSAIETFDGGFLILNEGKSGFGISCNVIRTDRYGIMLSEKNYFTSTTNAVIQTEDSGFVFVGRGIGNRCAAFKINKKGDSLWYRQYGTSFNDNLISIKQYYDGGLILIGIKYISTVKNGAFIIRTDSKGTLLWEKIITDSVYNYIIAYDLLIEKNNNIAITGFGNSDIPANTDMFLFKFTPSGNNYLKNFLYTFPQRESSIRIINSHDGNYILSGGAPSPGLCTHFTKVDTSGNLLFQRFYEYCTNYVEQTNDGNYILGGTIQNDQIFQYGLRKVNEEGTQVWLRILNGGWSRAYIRNFFKTRDGGFLFAGGFQDSILEIYSPYVARTNSEGQTNTPVNIFDPIEIVAEDFIFYSAYPNPFNPTTTISYELPMNSFVTLKVFDVAGKEVNTLVNEFKQAGNYQVTFNGNNLSSGVYYYRIQSREFVQVRKMILIK